MFLGGIWTMVRSNSWQSSANRQHRNANGSLIELMAALIVIIPIVLCLFDIGVMVITAMVNDSTCRSVARLASAGEPKDVQKRVEAALKRAEVHNAVLTNMRLEAGYPRNDDEVVMEEGAVTGPVNGKVTVRIAVDVHPPFLISHVMQQQSITMHSEQTFPYTYVRKGSSEIPN